MRPVIVHVIPWQMCLGGAQHVIAQLCDWARPWAQLHLVYLDKGSDRTWDHLREFVTFWPAATAEQAEATIQRIDPDLIHHHYPDNPWGIKNLFGRYPIIGTPHGWVGNQNPPDWAVPICGPHVRIRHGIDLQHYRPGKRPQPDGRFHVGIVGRLRADKVPHEFLNALATWLPGQRGRVVIHFIGRGLDDRAGRRTQQAAAAIHGVRLHGDIQPNEMPGIYNQLDAVLIPSARDSVSLVALEAMACEIPVIVRNIEGLPETVGSAGVICENDQALLTAIDRLRRDPEGRRELGRRGRERVKLLYDKRRMLDQYDAVYKRHLGSAGNTAESSGTVAEIAEPEVSVVMPVGDGLQPEWLSKAIMSVVRQEGCRFELVLVDDGLRDENLIHVAETAAREFDVRLFRLPENCGIPAALNLGLRHARADLVARADADDIMPAGRLAAQVAIMRADPTITVLCGDMLRILPDGNLTPMPSRVLRADQPLWEYWEGNWPVAHPTVMFRKHTIVDLGGYDESIPVAQDLDLWCRIQQAGLKIHKNDVVWNHYRIHANQATARRMNDVRAMAADVLDRYRQRRIT
jgi:glycosyltransferase involved in cell wall biosynthesis/GT2 family glycosyltransferase